MCCMRRAGAGIAAAAAVPAGPASGRRGYSMPRSAARSSARGCDSVSRRAVVSRARKARLLARALTAPVLPVRQDASPPLPEAKFLIDAVIAQPARGRVRLDGASSIPDRSFNEQVGWVVQLFTKLEQLERMESIERHRRANQPVSLS